MDKAKASCPASFSFIFKVCPNKNLIKMGSVGVGCTIDDEILVEVEKSSRDEVIFNGTTINFPTVHTVVKMLSPVSVCVSIKSPLPLGYGFGISSASALACAFALNKLFKLGKTRLELAKIAHIAEIKNYTGLGSVATQITGGFLVKNKPGIPACAGRPVDAVSLPFIGKKLYAVIIDRLETPTVLHDDNRLRRINEAADSAMSRIKKTGNITLEEVIEISYIFAEKSGLITNTEVKRVISEIRKSGGYATISMLGHVVLSTKKFDKIGDHTIKELVISDKKAIPG